MSAMLNKQVNRIGLVDRVLLLVIALLLGLLSYWRINFAFVHRLGEVSESSGAGYLYLVLFFLLLVFALFHIKNNRNNSILFWLFASYFIFSYLITDSFVITKLVSAICLFFWAFSYWFGRRLSALGPDYVSFFTRTLLYFVIIPLSIYCFVYFYTSDLFISQGSTDAFFYITAYFPFVLLIEKNKTLKTIMIIVFTVLSIISFKRSLIVGFSLCLLVFFLGSDFKQYFSKWYYWVLIIAVLVCSSYFFEFISESFIDRFSSFGEDGGSGRRDIYKQVLSALSQSDGFSLLFGHGYMSVTSITQSQILAHNDFLEVAYDFGLVGLAFYLAFILSLLKKAFKNPGKRDSIQTLHMAFVSSLVFFLVVSISNCVLYSPMIISPFMLSFGIATGALSKSHDC